MPEHKPRYRSDYLSLYFSPYRLRQRAQRAAEIIRRFELLHGKIDALAFAGVSGALSAAVIGVEANKPLILVRKKSEKSHSGHRVEGDLAAKTYLIVDDFVASGATAKYIQGEISARAPNAKCVGMLEMTYMSSLDDREYKEHIAEVPVVSRPGRRKVLGLR